VYGHADKRDAETAKGLTLDEASTHSEQHREAEGLTSRPRLLTERSPDFVGVAG